MASHLGYPTILERPRRCEHLSTPRTAVLVVPRRNQRPILARDIANGTAVSAQFASSNGTREPEGVRQINRARNLQEFVTGVKTFDVPQNFFYADTRGHIAYVASGEVPLREDLQAGAVVGLPPYLARNGQGGNEWLPAVTVDPFRALPCGATRSSDRRWWPRRHGVAWRSRRRANSN